MDFLRRRKPEEPRPRQSVSAASSVDDETLLNITIENGIDAVNALSGDGVTTDRGRHTTRRPKTRGAPHVSPEGGRHPSPDLPRSPTYINLSDRPMFMQWMNLGRDVHLKQIRQKKQANPVEGQTRQLIDVANAAQSTKGLSLRSLVKPCTVGLCEVVFMCIVGVREAIIGLCFRMTLIAIFNGSESRSHDLGNKWRMCLRVMAAMLIICYFILCVREMFSPLSIISFIYWLKLEHQKDWTAGTPKIPNYLVDYLSKHYTAKLDSLIAEAEHERLMQMSYRGVPDNESCGPRQTPSLLVRAMRVSGLTSLLAAAKRRFMTAAKPRENARGNTWPASGPRQTPSLLVSALRVLDRKCYRSEAPATRVTHQVLTSFMRHVAQLLGEADPRLHNATLVGIGSHFCGLRTSRLPDEMDWLLTVALGPGMRVEMDGGRSIVLVEEGSPSWHLWSKAWSGGSSLLTQVQGGLYKLNHWATSLHFRCLLDHVMSRVRLPEGFVHGGPLAPFFSRVGWSSPAATIILLDRDQHVFSQDISLGITIPLSVISREIQARIATLVRCSGMPQLDPVSLHVVPGKEPNAGWVASTAVLEARIMSRLGLDSPYVRVIRDVKLLMGELLAWGAPEDLVQRVRDALRAWGRGMEPDATWQDAIPGLDTDGLGASIKLYQLLSIHFAPVPNENEGKGQERERTFYSRAWLTMACLLRQHLGLGDGLTPLPHGDSESCDLCISLMINARNVPKSGLHPAVASALHCPDFHWLSVQSCHVKYWALAAMMDEWQDSPGGGATVTARPPLHQELHDAPQREDLLRRYLSRLVKGGVVANPILTESAPQVCPFTFHSGFYSFPLQRRASQMLIQIVQRLVKSKS